jgi:hypothetical protein
MVQAKQHEEELWKFQRQEHFLILEMRFGRNYFQYSLELYMQCYLNWNYSPEFGMNAGELKLMKGATAFQATIQAR